MSTAVVTASPLSARKPIYNSLFVQVVAGLVLGIILTCAFTRGWVATWSSVNILSMEPSFIDLRGFPAGLQVLHQGGDPLIANPLDPMQRPLNYPRLMLLLFAALGVTNSNLPVFGVVLCVLYLLCISCMILQSSSLAEALLLLISGISFVPLFAIEQGNTDLLIFSIIFLAAAIRKENIRPILLFVATLLKIYPLVTLIVDGLQRRSSNRRIPIALAALALLIFAIRWREFDAVRHATPASPILAYGVLSLKKAIFIISIEHGLSVRAAGTLAFSGLLLCWLTALLAFALAWRKPSAIDTSFFRSTHSAWFALFASIYAFSFAVGSNYDYRLIYLIPTLPFALDLARDPGHSRWGIAYIAATLLSLNWLNDGYGAGLLLEHGATFLVFLMVLSVLGKQTRYYLSDPAGAAH